MWDLDKPRERAIFIIFFLAAIFLFGRLIWLQVIEGWQLNQIASENAAKTITISAPRGLIFDRYGKLLVGNRATFAVYLMPNADQTQRETALQKLSVILGEPVAALNAVIDENKTTNFAPIVIRDELPVNLAARIQEAQNELPGIIVRWRPSRNYLYGKMLSHVLGYVGEISQKELDADGNQSFRSGDYIGKDGVEKIYDRFLRGIDGGQKVEVDVRGRPTKITEATDPVPGNNLYLTIDSDLQQVVEKVLEGHSGAIVIINPQNGEVLALASRPNFDPDLFNRHLTPAQWQAFDVGHPFMDRALSPYPPGSTFKPITLAATLQENAWPINQTINCPGYLQVGSRIAKCWKETGHGNINIIEGLVWSCDVVYYTLGLKLGPDVMSKYAKYFGLGQKTGIDLPQERFGQIPDSNWKKQTLKDDWRAGDSINMATGQGFTLVTPLQSAIYYGEIATGKRYRPFVVKQVVSRGGAILMKNEPDLVSTLTIDEAHRILIRDTLAAVVSRGTGRRADVKGLPAGGKTGTAENPGLPHAWFSSFAPVQNPELAMAVFIEHGQHGDQVSAQLTGEILQWYKENRLTREIK